MAVLRFRPHHFLCTVGFEGKGYSDSFVENFTRIADQLRATVDGDDTIIEVTEVTDSICTPCPNRIGTLCQTQEKIARLDRGHAAVLGLVPGERLTWGEAKRRIREKMTKENFDRVCEPCSWKAYGMCEKALNRLKEEKTPLQAPVARALILALVSAFSLAIASPAHAAKKREVAASAKSSTKKSRTKASVTPAPTAPVDPIEALAKLKPGNVTKALKRAQDALEKAQCEKVRKETASAVSGTEFVDHGLILRGRCAEEKAFEHLDEKKWDEALKVAATGIADLEKLMRDQIYSPWLKDAPEEIGKLELVRGLAYSKKKKWAESTRETETALQRLTLENSLYYLTPAMIEGYATACQKKESPLCRSWIQRLANTYAKHSAESKTLAKHFPEVVEAAKPNFANSKITMGYKQKDADEDAFDKAYPLVLEGKWRDAKEALETFLTDYSRSSHRHRARYWLGYVYEKDQNFEAAKPYYEQVLKESPLTLYGLLSSFALKTPLATRFSADRPALSDTDDFQTPVEALRVSRAKKLIAAKAYRLAARDLRDIRARDTASGAYLLYLAKLGSLAGSHLSTFSILTEMIQRNDETVYTSFGLDLVFPVVEWEIIQKQAKDQGLDPVLVLSLIKQESAFEGQAHSVSGASGYMQLMPFTASDVEGDVERRDLLDAETNIRIGTKYLKKLLAKYSSNVPMALAAYNAGPTAVDRWIREGKASRGMLEFIEQIPYKETRDYVGTIFRNYVWYKKRLESKEVVTTEDFWPVGPAPKAGSTALPPTASAPVASPSPETPEPSPSPL